MTHLPGHDGKVILHKKIISIFHQAYKGEIDHCRRFSVRIETTSKFLIVSVRLMLPKVGVDGLSGHDEKVTSDKIIISIP